MIDDLAQICFLELKSKDNLHSNLLSKLQLFLIGEGYHVMREYPIDFNTIRRRTRKEFVKLGYIDIYAEKRNRSLLNYTSSKELNNNSPLNIAIEFDSGNLLKYKSIEKLLQSGADTCLGIVRGKSKATDLTSLNIERIREIKIQCDIDFNNFYLIMICNNLLLKCF